ncbi:hypothetical protein U2F26_29300 [Micromonospora sp. 4G57]|uniref:Uncharacterized protein n=1 Tax=Micromonospora sicca TaxID=2202420 RepID=A0ABU5JLK7_9ACTN|nr:MULTISPECIES: hypothetical protein [unclassified Micromonospora]MDZ5446774.1 hypothetical protein [Micromonospora sp. 4G57]MDZ5493509.1 hypothetical protein [Micromonospora sp. 4G53]
MIPRVITGQAIIFGRKPVSDYLEVLRHLTHQEGYALDADELDQTCSQHPDSVCALLSAACIIAAANAQIAALTAAADLLCTVHAAGDAKTVMSLRQRLDRVADALTRALAQRDNATARLRHECTALTDLGTGLITRRGDSTPAR